MVVKSLKELIDYRHTLTMTSTLHQPLDDSIEILIGMGTCDIAAGAKETLEAFQEIISSKKQKNITVSSVGCIGYCSMEPTVEIHMPNRAPVIYSKITKDKVAELFQTVIVRNEPYENEEIIKSFHNSRVFLQTKQTILVSTSTNGSVDETNQIIDALKTEIINHNLYEDVTVITTGGVEIVDQGTMITVQPDHVLYGNVHVQDVLDIIEQHIIHNKVVQRLVVNTIENDSAIESMMKADFYQKQLRIALRNCGFINPEKITDYIAVRGYEALGLCLTTKTPQEVVQIIKDSQLRGRGGGGFPTGLKWEYTAREISDEKYIICNADEGDPGAFMDRSILEGDPNSVLEAMAIAGYAIGSNYGIVYIRAEYPLAIERLIIALEQAREYGMLGKNIFGSGFDFDIEIRLGAGAFVCGEETALINSIQGLRGEPKKKPPFPSVSGFRNKPTSVNNVETFANIVPIILNGPTWFASIGTEHSKGTKVFALAGKIHNVGLVEVPMGTTLREIVYDIGGGIVGNKALKALQTGGPSGGVITDEHLDTPIDYESLKAIGSMMGSGGMIVLDEDDDMVKLAKFYLDFTQDESCGKCTPCRIGTKRLYEILDRLVSLQGSPDDLDLLEDLAVNIKNSALCGLGQTAPNPVLSTLKYFKEEYDAYANRTKRTAYRIIEEKCIGCTKCKRVCPVDCITGMVKIPHVIDESNCIACGACYDACNFEAIERP